MFLYPLQSVELFCKVDVPWSRKRSLSFDTLFVTLHLNQHDSLPTGGNRNKKNILNLNKLYSSNFSRQGKGVELIERGEVLFFPSVLSGRSVCASLAMTPDRRKKKKKKILLSDKVSFFLIIIIIISPLFAMSD